MTMEQNCSILTLTRGFERDPYDMIVGESLRAAREERLCNVTRMASELGITRQRLALYEKGYRGLNIRTLTAFSIALDTTPTALIGQLDEFIREAASESRRYMAAAGAPPPQFR